MHLNPYLGYDSAYTYPINALLLISYTAVDSVTFRYARSPAAHKNQKITNTSVCPFGDGSSLIGWNTYYTILFAIGPRIPSPHPTVACLFLMTTGSKFSVFKHVSVDFPFFFFAFFSSGILSVGTPSASGFHILTVSGCTARPFLPTFIVPVTVLSTTSSVFRCLYPEVRGMTQ